MKDGIKDLYKKDPKLAKEVAKVLGFKIVAKKDPVVEKISALIKTYLKVKPKKIRTKKIDNKTIYQFGKLVSEGTGQIVVKLINDRGKWSYAIGVPNVSSPEHEDIATEPFLGMDRAADEDKIFLSLEKILQKAKNFMKSRGIEINKEGIVGY